MIIVTGANGQLGRQVVEQLLERVPAEGIGVSVRDPDVAQALADRGVRVRRGDFDDPAGLAHAFEGAVRVLVVSASALGEQAVAWNRAAVDAAVAAGAERVFYTSHVGARPDSPFPPMPTHAAVESALAASGVAHTILRNGFYASTVPRLVGDARETGELRAPEDGPVSWTGHADLAAATAAALAGDDMADGVVALTAAEAVDLAEVAEWLSVRRVVISDDEFRAGMIAGGAPELAATMTLGIFQAARRGDFACVDPALEQLAGRPPTPLRDLL